MTRTDWLWISSLLWFPLYMWTILYVLDKSWSFFDRLLSRWIH